MSNLAARAPSRPTVGGEFELRGMGDKLGGKPYMPMPNPDGGTLYVSPDTPIKDVYSDASLAQVGEYNASRRRLLDSVDNYNQALQGKTPDVRGGGSTGRGKSDTTPHYVLDGQSPPVDAGDDYNSRADWKRFNAGETSAKGSTAMRANRSASLIMSRKKSDMALGEKQIDTILAEMSKKGRQ